MKISKNIYSVAAAFIAAFVFFGFFYPYHLIRREQLTLFLYDFPYILRTYGGAGCVSRFFGDFLEQFFCFRFIGPIAVSALLTTIAVLTYRICRNFAGKKVSFILSLLVYCWSFLRETDTIYITQYTLAVAGYLLCAYAALKFQNTVVRICSLIFFPLTGLFLFGNPFHKDYGKPIGKPDFDYEKIIALDVESSRENWDKVLEISDSKLMYNEACYLENLAAAMKGQLSDKLLSHPQNYANGLFLFISDATPFSNSAAGEVWYYLGNMTLADQSAIISIQFSPKHTGARYIKRLAMINLISEETAAAQKYLNMLRRTLVYRKWAESMMPENQDETTRTALDAARANLVRTDKIGPSNNYRLLLKELREANPDNRMAREYLLCYELLSLDLVAFMEDYDPQRDKSTLYQEAALVWLNIMHNEGKLRNEKPGDYGITEDTANRLMKFYRFPDRYKNTYWYYFTYASE